MTLARRPLVAFATLVALAAAPSRAAAIGRERSGDFKAEYLFNFATSAGTLKQGFQGLTYDAVGNELYAVNNGLVRVFNAAGVEVYAFGEEAEFGGTIAAAPLESGDILILASS